MKTTEPFKKAIEKHLNELAIKDELFAETLKKENKNIDDCCTYILNQVKASGCNGFADEEIYGMAVHYYDEDNIEIGKPIKGQVVVNHHVELTEEDKAAAKQKAIDILVEQSKEEAKKELASKIELNDEDIAEAKRLAMEKVVDEQKQKVIKKKTAQSEKEKSEVKQVDLFS